MGPNRSRATQAEASRRAPLATCLGRRPSRASRHSAHVGGACGGDDASTRRHRSSAPCRRSRPAARTPEGRNTRWDARRSTAAVSILAGSDFAGLAKVATLLDRTRSEPSRLMLTSVRPDALARLGTSPLMNTSRWLLWWSCAVSRAPSAFGSSTYNPMLMVVAKSFRPARTARSTICRRAKSSADVPRPRPLCPLAGRREQPLKAMPLPNDPVIDQPLGRPAR
jgi:hypothetical protein